MEDTDYDWENEQQLNGLPMDQNDGEQQLNGLSASTSGTLEQGSGGASSPVESADAEEEYDDDTVVVPREEFENLKYQLQLMQHAQLEKQAREHEQARMVKDMFNQNSLVHGALAFMHERLLKVEKATGCPPDFGRIPGGCRIVVDRSRSPSPAADDREYRDRDRPLQNKKVRGRSQLQIQVPDKMPVQSASNALPTPNTSFTSNMSVPTPMLPLTPGRIGPPPGLKKAITIVAKRGPHNLDKIMPPPLTFIPLVPLTDTEIIVYFFQSLTRPIVSLRLYSRGWGPAQICDTLNSHRSIVPEYLRNTCSVKCTTAIKKGREKFGDAWEADNRKIFADPQYSDDMKVTDMISLSPDEMLKAVNWEVRKLCDGLIKHPGPEDGGIFTRCVKYCQEHNAKYTLRDIWELATDLNNGRTPRRVMSETSSESSGVSQEDEQMEDGEDDNASRASGDGDSVVGQDDAPASAESV